MSSAQPLAQFAQPRVFAADFAADIPAGTTTGGLTMLSSTQVSLYGVTRAVGVAVAVCRGTDSGSWTAGISSQNNLFSIADSLRFIVGFSTTPTTALTFTRSGTSAAPVSLMYAVLSPFGGTASYAGCNGQFVGTANSTNLAYPYHAYIAQPDIRLVFAAVEERAGGTADDPASYFHYNTQSVFAPGSRYLYIGAENTVGNGMSDIPAHNSFNFLSGHRTGVLQLNIRNRFR